MAARKLQMEIDKALKKVAEGVDEFKAMVEKLHQAATSAQREKIEAELKRDIKKLQRMRDQIKTWIGSSEIKDKRALLENRRLIETQMELFKAIEKELKTKAFSKEGLGLPTKVDPEEEKKEQCAEWIRDTVDRFNQQIDMCEAQQESILASVGKRGKKSGGSNESLDRLKHQADVCRQHIRYLEIALRMLENGLLEADPIDELRDNIDYFLEQGSEAITDGTEIEDYLDIYDELGLDEEDELFAGPPMPSAIASAAPSAPSSSVPPTPAKPVISGPPPTITASLPSTAAAATALSPKMGVGRTASTPSAANADSAPSSASAPGHPPSVPPSVPTPAVNVTTPAPSSTSQTSAPPLQPPKLTAWNQKVKEGTTPSRTGSLNVPGGPADHHEEPVPSAAPSVSSATATPKASVGLTAGLSTADSSVHSTPMSSPTPSRPANKQPPLQPPSASSSSKPTSSSTGTVSSSRASSMSPSPASRSAFSSAGRAPSVPAPVHELSPAPRSSTVPSSDVNSTISSSTASLDDHAPSTSNDDQVSALTTEFGSSKLSLSGAPTDAVLVNGVFPTPPPPPPHAYKPKPQQPLKPIRQVSKDPACPEALRDLMAIFEAVQHSARGAYVNGVSPPGASGTAAADGSTTPAPPTKKDAAASALGLIADPRTPPSPTSAASPPRPPSWPPSAAASDLLGMLESTWMWAPSPLDSERHTPYAPVDPTPVPHYYPMLPPPVVDDPRLFEQLDLDTLFYVFYYRQGTLAQYLAARELKRQSWRFHKRYQTWFQRHEEPREITAEYEAGAYIYFDWEVGWCQRKKTEFKFEYRYLEDAELD